jgi:hypothetical protein
MYNVRIIDASGKMLLGADSVNDEFIKDIIQIYGKFGIQIIIKKVDNEGVCND